MLLGKSFPPGLSLTHTTPGHAVPVLHPTAPPRAQRGAGRPLFAGSPREGRVLSPQGSRFRVRRGSALGAGAGGAQPPVPLQRLRDTPGPEPRGLPAVGVPGRGSPHGARPGYPTPTRRAAGPGGPGSARDPGTGRAPRGAGAGAAAARARSSPCLLPGAGPPGPPPPATDAPGWAPRNPQGWGRAPRPAGTPLRSPAAPRATAAFGFSAYRLHLCGFGPSTRNS